MKAALYSAYGSGGNLCRAAISRNACFSEHFGNDYSLSHCADFGHCAKVVRNLWHSSRVRVKIAEKRVILSSLILSITANLLKERLLSLVILKLFASN